MHTPPTQAGREKRTRRNGQPGPVRTAACAAVWRSVRVRWGALLAVVALVAMRTSASIITPLAAVPADIAPEPTVVAPDCALRLCPPPELSAPADQPPGGHDAYPREGSALLESESVLHLGSGPLPGTLAPMAAHGLGLSAFRYANQLRQQPAQLADTDVVSGKGPFLVTYDGLHPRLQTFDGSSYQGILLTFRRQRPEPPTASLLYDIETGGLLIPAVASVAPQREKVATAMQRTVSSATLGGGLLCFCFLGYLRRAVPALPDQAMLADAFNRPRLPPKPDSQPVRIPRPLSTSIYARVLRVTDWAATPSTDALMNEAAVPVEREPVTEPYGRYTLLGAPRPLSHFHLRGNTALLSYAAQLSLLLMRTPSVV